MPCWSSCWKWVVAPVTLLDGDLVRKTLSSELGFSKEHRDLNIRRIGYVAAEITKAGGIAICAPIAPYDATRTRCQEFGIGVGGIRPGSRSNPDSRSARCATAKASTRRQEQV